MTHWEAFFREKITQILREKKSLIDIGGGLRISKEKGNRFSPRNEWIAGMIKTRGVSYKVLDPVLDYCPDIVGDIHALPFPDNSQEAIACIAVLEHVTDPFAASREMHRVLARGGYCFVYLPFLYYFHAEKGYYGDYWRFTHEGTALLFKDFSRVEIQPVRGAIGTLMRLTPAGRYPFLERMFYAADIICGKLRSKQVSGFYIFLEK
jgi:SAM-dependent methyltransferase